MHTFIDFPHLGIHLEDVGKTLTVFGFDIAYYGITIAIGMLAGIFVATQMASVPVRSRKIMWIWQFSGLFSGSSGPGFIL